MGKVSQTLVAIATCATLATAGDYTSFQTSDTMLISADAKTGTASTPCIVGDSGMVVRQLEQGPPLIIAQAIITSKAQDQATLSFQPFNALTQDALPLPLVTPQKGDHVLFHPFGKRGMVIAPTSESYQKATNAYSGFTWIHPDHLAASLTQEGNPIPRIENFQKTCDDNTLEYLIVVMPKGDQIVDCRSGKMLGFHERPDNGFDEVKAQLPFYHRVGEIKRGLFNFGPSAISNYTQHYTQLFGAAQ